MAVHNHRPWEPICNERRLEDGTLRGACLHDDGTPFRPKLHPSLPGANAAEGERVVALEDLEE